ncbi:alpha/beta hydrolase [Aspergillus affinis]|uniref:alpha/beta hydrolase n=1 Tax=Aspergillus affinis TaxID=1070780 RepID=UPI0022FEDC45|nr:alpha/beta-hydrolase [Aspergillus affinis]KAI9044723.1 alpha/beta-hydrolase [Aspergillus affinis]
MTAAKPTIVLVHGAWHTRPSYRRYIDDLTAHGFTVYCPQLPSCSLSRPPVAGYADDVAAVRRTVEPLVNAGQRVLILMHSYGGIVGTDAVANLTWPERQAQNLPGGVVHLVYLCAYIVRPGASVLSVCQEAGMMHLWPQWVENADDGTTFPVDPVLMFLGGVDRTLIDEALSHLVRSPHDVFMTPAEGDAWKKIPGTYVLTQNDYSVPRIYQDLMLKKVREDGVEMRLLDYNTGHSIFLTMPDEMVQLIEEAAVDERNPR